MLLEPRVQREDHIVLANRRGCTDLRMEHHTVLGEAAVLLEVQGEDHQEVPTGYPADSNTFLKLLLGNCDKYLGWTTLPSCTATALAKRNRSPAVSSRILHATPSSCGKDSPRHRQEQVQQVHHSWLHTVVWLWTLPAQMICQTRMFVPH